MIRILCVFISCGPFFLLINPHFKLSHNEFFLFLFDFQDATEPSFLFQIQNHSFALRLIFEIELSRYENLSRMIH